jgi:hypothetical protein
MQNSVPDRLADGDLYAVDVGSDLPREPGDRVACYRDVRRL